MMVAHFSCISVDCTLFIDIFVSYHFFINSSLRIESLVSITAYGVYLYLFVICSESETFNYLEMVIKEEKPRTPILGCRLGFALQPLSKSVPDQEHFIRKYKRSIINWVSL